MPSIFETYFRDPAYFQRMLEFFLHARFRAVRLHIQDKKSESVFFAVDGTLVNVRNNKRRFSTLTEWFNAVQGTGHDMYYTGIFNQIYITHRVTIGDILRTVDLSEIREFQDTKYRSSIAYNYIFRRLRANFIGCDWEKQQVYEVVWKGHTYAVAINNTYSADGGNVRIFLEKFVGNKEVPGLEICLADGTRRFVTEPVGKEVPRDVPKDSPKEEPVEIPRESLMEDWMKREMKEWGAKIEEILESQIILRQENEHMQTELEELKKQNASMSQQMQTLAGQCNHLLGAVGYLLQLKQPQQLLQPLPSPSLPFPPIFVPFPQNLNR